MNTNSVFQERLKLVCDHLLSRKGTVTRQEIGMLLAKRTYIRKFATLWTTTDILIREMKKYKMIEATEKRGVYKVIAYGTKR